MAEFTNMNEGKSQLKILWEKICERLEKVVTPISFDTFIRDLEPVDISGRHLILRAGTDLAAATIISKHSTQIKDAILKYEGGYDPYGLDADYMEANKWLNFILENDMNYTLFRYGEVPSDPNKVKAQFMFTKGNEATAYKGTWTYEMLSDSGKWYYDNVLHATGFIKAADFDYRYDYK